MIKRIISPLIIFLLFVSQISLFCKNIGDKTSSNPFFTEFNQIIEYNSITPENVKSATELTINKAQNSLSNIYNIEKDKRTFENTVLALDNMYNDIYMVYGPVYLIANTHPDAEIRNTSNAEIAAFSKFFNELSLDEKLYGALKDYSETKEAKNLTGYKRRFLDKTIADFERDGLNLPAQERDELKALQDSLSDMSIEFEKNIAEVNDFLMVEEAEMESLDEEYKNTHRTEDKKYKIDLSYPSYFPFMKFSTSDRARKKLYIKYNNRAAEKNIALLQEVLKVRKQIASLLSYNSYAEYITEDRMAKNPANVWNFEESLIAKVKEKASYDYDELLEVKREYLNDQGVNVIQPWEASFFNDRLLKEKYKLNQNKVKEYFELNNVLDGLFMIAQQLFDVEFKEINNPKVWQDDARLFEVIQDSKVISYFYLDLFPRDNKFSHAACFPMIKGKMTNDGYQMPVASLVCNFPRPSENQPSLLLHSEVETFFHEFGHVLHNVLTKAKLASFSGTSVSRDFVEAPSQIFENWVWNYNILTLFAKHYKTNEPLPESLYNKMFAAKNVGSGLATLQQIFYGLIDFTLHDKYDPYGNTTTTDVVKKLQNEITFYPYLEGTNMQSAFGHLMGYAAGYYGYLWSKVYAQDMYSIFEKNGAMDKETGKRYRDIILAKGGSEDELSLVMEFLQREPNQEAFLRSLGLNEKGD
jgi:thimet oligopeptidase